MWLTCILDVVRLILIKMTNEMQLCRIIYYSIIPWLFFMFQAILSLIIRSVLTVITASGFIHINNGTINHPTQLHVFAHFYKNYR